MSIPLTLHCECGEELTAKAGETVTCGCGRRYDTSTIPASSIARVRATQARMRLYARLGLAVVVAFGALGFLALGWPGVALMASLSAIIWWRIVAPVLRRHHADDLTDLPSWELEADRDG
jgi:fatty acid desaturase